MIETDSPKRWPLRLASQRDALPDEANHMNRVLLLAWTPLPATKTAECHIAGLLPDAQCTPGAVQTTDLGIVCGTSTRTRRHVTKETRKRVFAAYGLPLPRDPVAYELDHLISLELGGSNDAANLWPEAAPGFHDKDKIEDYLHRAVCAGRMSIDDAQRAIATDWTRVALR